MTHVSESCKTSLVSVCGAAAADLIPPAGGAGLVPLLVLFMAAECVCQLVVSLAPPLWPPPAITPAQVMNTD